VGRYLRLLKLQLRTSALLAAQYGGTFSSTGSSRWCGRHGGRAADHRVRGASKRGISGWSAEEALVVTGWFVVLQAILDGAINPGLQAVVEHIRKGTLDFVLLKPADAQFLVSTSRFQCGA